jgi:hypothetical protein
MRDNLEITRQPLAVDRIELEDVPFPPQAAVGVEQICFSQ